MTTIQTIAATTECNDVIPEQMNTELTILSGKFAGTCYAKEGYQTIRTQPVKARRNADIIRYSSTAW